MTPAESMSARVKVSPAFTSTLGETFQPCPRSRASRAPVPSVARPPPPGLPSKFSGLMERVVTGRRAARPAWAREEMAGRVTGHSLVDRLRSGNVYMHDSDAHRARQTPLTGVFAPWRTQTSHAPLTPPREAPTVLRNRLLSPFAHRRVLQEALPCGSDPTDPHPPPGCRDVACSAARRRLSAPGFSPLAEETPATTPPYHSSTSTA